jgi:hypothetical protein
VGASQLENERLKAPQHVWYCANWRTTSWRMSD